MNQDSKRKLHYVYELLRTSQGAGPRRYIGVRTAPNGDPEADEYWSSSEKIQKERDAGATFSKRVLATFETREDAEFFEAELHWQHMVGKDPHFYNVTAQLIEGKVGLLFPRERYISPEGKHLWFKRGSEPEGWRHDPAQWAQFRIADHSDKLNQLGGFPQTYLGLELPEWEFHKFYPAELAFAVTQPRHCHEPYVKLDYRNDVLDCYYFPAGGQPDGWVRGFAPNSQIGSNVPAGWRAYFHIHPQKTSSAYFARGEEPNGWVDAESLSNIVKRRSADETVPSRIKSELTHIFHIAESEADARARLRSFRIHAAEQFSPPNWVSLVSELDLSRSQKAEVIKIIGKDSVSLAFHSVFDGARSVEDDVARRALIHNGVANIFSMNQENLSAGEWAKTIAHLDLCDSEKKLAHALIKDKIEIWSFSEKVPPLSDFEQGPESQFVPPTILAETPFDDHVGGMLALATRLHKAAMSQLDKPKADPMPQLLKAQKLLEEAEVLASDAATYIDTAQMNEALAELHRQQGEVRAMIAQVKSSNRTPSMLIAGFVLVVILGLLVSFTI